MTPAAADSTTVLAVATPRAAQLIAPAHTTTPFTCHYYYYSVVEICLPLCEISFQASTPFIANLKPSGEYVMTDLHEVRPGCNG